MLVVNRDNQACGAGMAPLALRLLELGKRADQAPGVPRPTSLEGGQASHTARPQPAAWVSSRRILVVEDETALRELIAQLLEDEGYLVERAANGGEALLKLQLVRPDVVVLDLMMPVMDGWAFAQACHTLSAGEAIPILVTSASRELARAAEQLRPYGVRAAVAKPFDLDVLLAAVERLANRPAAVEWPG